MKAVILAGGKSSRLSVFGRWLPKVLLPIKGKPLLALIIEDVLRNKEVTEVIVLAGKNYLVNAFIYSTCFSKPVKVLNFDKGVIGDLLCIKTAIGKSPFILQNGDNLVPARFPSATVFRSSKAILLVVVTDQIYGLTRCSIVRNRIAAINNSTKLNMEFGILGKKLVSPSIFKIITASSYHSTIGDFSQQVFNSRRRIDVITVKNTSFIHINYLSDWLSKCNAADLFRFFLFGVKLRLVAPLRQLSLVVLACTIVFIY